MKYFYNLRLLLLLANISILTGSCQDDSNERGTGGQSSKNDILTVTVNLDDPRQTIHNFGASDAWSCQFVGKNWPSDKKEKIADLLFSREVDETGNPLGIGLSAWRFNIGGGSAEQGDNSLINDDWRRSESFLLLDGSFDPSKHEGQRWFLKAAKARGVEQFIAFVNSPPVSLTKNGKAFNEKDGEPYANLPASNYTAYANFLADVAERLRDDDIDLDYISPFNEPQWKWECCNQEGSPWTNKEISVISKEINEVFESRNITTKLEIAEAAKINFLYRAEPEFPQRSNQVEEFFKTNSGLYLEDIPLMAKKIAGHSYFTTWDVNTMIDMRKELALKIQSVNPNLEYWMTEYSILENNEEIKGNGRDLTVNTALYVARVIHHDLTVANASAWQWWLGVSPYDYKDGLVYIDHSKFGGEIYDSKTLWVMGNFSRFIRPGMVRVNTSRSDNATDYESALDLMTSAYIGTNSEMVIVFINYRNSDKKVNLKLNGANVAEGTTFSQYLTGRGGDENLKYTGTVAAGNEIIIPARSVLSLVSGK
ncbi:glycoside hydrolase [Fulvivirgaceae bacterium BMA12]|uniref:Glycoside hydrolase n=1 Tax=Agaribacillus aureus TaxID=3051825 RepID=A0ABT8LKK3_9BACT|nr:glycoside hydrolase [Fulvivirgaceae bacterium BMA12]